MVKGCWLVILAVALVAGLAAPAAAQTQARRTVIRLDEISVEGRIQKPQAFYILPRSSLNYEGLEREDSFLPKIERSLEKEPF